MNDYLKERERKYLLWRRESAVRSALQSLQFWTEREKRARKEKPTWFVYIASVKKRRKQAESDFQYSTQRLAQFVQEHKIPYVLMSA